MCIKKMFITLLLVSISLLPLYSQTETAGNGGEVIDLDEARSAIEEERISQVNELLTENKIVEIEELFTSARMDIRQGKNLYSLWAT